MKFSLSWLKDEGGGTVDKCSLKITQTSQSSLKSWQFGGYASLYEQEVA